jgi:hypothetical protein
VAVDHTSDGPSAHWRAWLAHTFHGLTWKRFGILCLILAFFALHQPYMAGAMQFEKDLLGKVLGSFRSFAQVFLSFVPVLLAVIAVENRGPRSTPVRVLWLCAAVVLGHAVGAVLWAIIMPLVWSGHPLFGPTSDTVRKVTYFAGHSVRLMAFSALATALYFYLKRDAEVVQALHQESIDREASERENAEARLQVMQAQIEPHFLFNTLASVRRLYETDRTAGRSMLQHLSSYLTSSLPRMRESRSTLERELALAIAYLNVQRIRMESRLAFEVDVPPSLLSVVVPPMMLATLVENAVIHGLSPIPAGGTIRIKAHVESGKLVLEVEDDGRGLQETWGGGVGLANIRARLKSEYGGEAQMQLNQRSSGGVTATLEIPLPAASMAKAA